MLLYQIPDNFRLEAGEQSVKIPAGTYTIAFYWQDRPYNVYHWRTPAGTYLGSYFNIVSDTEIAEKMVSYTDMIIDVMVLPDGSYTVLDEDELSVPLQEFAGGAVAQHLNQLIAQLDSLHTYIKEETDREIEKGNIKGISFS